MHFMDKLYGIYWWNSSLESAQQNHRLSWGNKFVQLSMLSAHMTASHLDAYCGSLWTHARATLWISNQLNEAPQLSQIDTL